MKKLALCYSLHFRFGLLSYHFVSLFCRIRIISNQILGILANAIDAMMSDQPSDDLKDLLDVSEKWSAFHEKGLEYYTNFLLCMESVNH